MDKVILMPPFKNVHRLIVIAGCKQGPLKRSVCKCPTGQAVSHENQALTDNRKLPAVLNAGNRMALDA